MITKIVHIKSQILQKLCKIALLIMFFQYLAYRSNRMYNLSHFQNTYKGKNKY